MVVSSWKTFAHILAQPTGYAVVQVACKNFHNVYFITLFHEKIYFMSWIKRAKENINRSRPLHVYQTTIRQYSFENINQF